MSARELFDRVKTQLTGGQSLDIVRLREDIHDEYDRGTTLADRVILLSIHKAVFDAAERQIARENLEKFRQARQQDYSLLIIREAVIGQPPAMETSIQKSLPQ